MTDIPRFISWSKWHDPLNSEDSEFEYIPEKDVQNFDNNQNEIYDEDDEEEDGNPTPVIITPLAIIPLKPFNNPTKVFNFWLGETTFTLSKRVASIINDIPGVEILDIFTRYKFRIAVGNNFPFQYVRQSIEKALDASPPVKNNSINMNLDNDIRAQIQSIIQVQLAKFPFWAIYICPNGQVDISADHKNTDEFKHRLDLYTSARELAGGAIIKYDEQLV